MATALFFNQSAISTFSAAYGVKAGSGVLLCGKNDFSLLLAYLATIQLGARVLGVNPSFPADKIQHIAECYQCDFILIGLLSCLKICKI